MRRPQLTAFLLVSLLGGGCMKVPLTNESGTPATLFIGSSEGLLVTTDNGLSGETRSTSSGLPSTIVDSLGRSGGSLFVGTAGGLAVSTDKGRSFKSVQVGTQSSFGNPIRAISASGTNVYVLSDTVYVSRDGGGTFKATPSPWEAVTTSDSNTVYGNTVYCILASGSSFLVGTQNGVYLSADGGSHFSSYATSFAFHGLVSTGAAYVAWVERNGSSADELQVSRDGGKTWSATGASAGLSSINGISASGSLVAIGATNGLFVSTDGGGSFAGRTTKNGLGDDLIYFVYAFGSAVYASTAGGFSFSLDAGKSFHNQTSVGSLSPSVFSSAIGMN